MFASNEPFTSRVNALSCGLQYLGEIASAPAGIVLVAPGTEP